MVYLGWFCGAIIFGMISDSFGRKTSLMLSIGLMSITGVTSSFVNIFWLFALLKVFVGAGIGKLIVSVFSEVFLNDSETTAAILLNLITLAFDLQIFIPF